MIITPKKLLEYEGILQLQSDMHQGIICFETTVHGLVPHARIRVGDSQCFQPLVPLI